MKQKREWTFLRKRTLPLFSDAPLVASGPVAWVADLSVRLVSGLAYASAEDLCIGVEAAKRMRKRRSPAGEAPIPSRKPPSLAHKLAGPVARLRGLRWQAEI